MIAFRLTLLAECFTVAALFRFASPGLRRILRKRDAAIVSRRLFFDQWRLCTCRQAMKVLRALAPLHLAEGATPPRKGVPLVRCRSCLNMIDDEHLDFGSFGNQLQSELFL